MWHVVALIPLADSFETLHNDFIGLEDDARHFEILKIIINDFLMEVLSKISHFDKSCCCDHELLPPL